MEAQKKAAEVGGTLAQGQTRGLSKEQAAKELGEFPELAWTKVENPAYQSMYEQWEEMQEKLAEEQR